MDILFTINHSYVEQVKLVMQSVCLNNPGKHKFWFIHTEIEMESQISIQEYAKEHCNDSVAEFVMFDKKEMLDLPLHGLSWSIEIYFRLFAQYLLPIDKVLYLDGDVLVDGNLQEFYNAIFENGKYFHCVANDIVDTQNARLGLPKDNIYINSGVLLMNLEELRKIPIEKTMELLWENKERFTFPDQDYINCIYRENKKVFDNRYNYMISVAEINPDYQKREDIRICHYVMEKPWSAKFPYKTDWLFFKYLAKEGKWIQIICLWTLHRLYRLYQLICVPKQHRRI